MLRLLIVDDEVIVRKWLRLTFQPFPEEFLIVDAVADGRKALEVCRSHAVDVVITDMIMPDMDGMAFIQILREFDLNTQVIILSNYADFSLAQKGMSFGAAEYLLKGEVTEEELLSVVRRVGKKTFGENRKTERDFMGLSPRQINQLLMGGAPEPAKMMDDAIAARKEGRIWCAVFSQDADPIAVRTSGEIKGLEWATQLTELLEKALLPGTVYVIADHIAAALVWMEGEPKAADAFFKRQIRLLPEMSPRLSFSVGTDGPASSAAELERAFSHACSAIYFRFFFGPGSVCAYAAPQKAGSYTDFHEETRAAQRLIRGGELNQLEKLLKRVCDPREQYTVEDIDHLRRLFNAAAEALIHYTLMYCPETGEPMLFSNVNPMAEIGKMLFLDDIMAWMSRLIHTCQHYLQRAANEGNLRRVFEYMEQNYMHNLTLNQISEVAGFSPNYFCNIFKECTGKSVNVYLTELRIQRAKQLLTSTNKSVNLIAEEVGYESSSYFIKVFKSMAGDTPNHFRRANRE